MLDRYTFENGNMYFDDRGKYVTYEDYLKLKQALEKIMGIAEEVI